MVALLLGALLTLPGQSAPAPVEVSAGEQPILHVALSVPTGSLGVTSLARIFEVVAEEIEALAPMFVRELTEAKTRACVEERAADRIRCLYELSEAEAAERSGGFTIVVSAVPDGEVDLVSAFLIDHQKAAEVVTQASRLGQPAEVVEQALSVRALVGSLQPAEIRGDQDLIDWVRVRFRTDFAPPIAEAGLMTPLGRLDVRVTVPEVEVLLDGAVLSVVGADGRLLVTDVREGERRVAAAGAIIEPAEALATVVRGRTTRVELAPSLRASRTDRTLMNELTFWSGVAAGAVGGGLTVAGALREPDEVYLRGFPGVTPPEAGTDAPVLGLGLLAGGGMLAGAVALFRDDHEIPWLPIALGLAAGAVAAGGAAFVSR